MGTIRERRCGAPLSLSHWVRFVFASLLRYYQCAIVCGPSHVTWLRSYSPNGALCSLRIVLCHCTLLSPLFLRMAHDHHAAGMRPVTATNHTSSEARAIRFPTLLPYMCVVFLFSNFAITVFILPQYGSKSVFAQRSHLRYQAITVGRKFRRSEKSLLNVPCGLSALWTASHASNLG